MQSNRHSHSIGSYPCSTGSYFHSIGPYLSCIRSYLHSIGSCLSSIRSYLNYFVASYITLVCSSVAFHIYPYLCGNSIPSDRNYRSAVVTIWSAVKRRRLNLHSGQTFKSITAVADLQKLPTSLSLGTTY